MAFFPALTAASRPAFCGIDESTIVHPFCPDGHWISVFDGGGGGGCSGAVVVGTVGSVDVSVGVDVVGAVPVLNGTEAWVSARVFVGESLPWVARIPTAAASAATIRSPRTGQIQSPGYRLNRRRHAVASAGMAPRCTGSRRPHSRQYSWSGSYGVPQRGHSPPSASGAGGGPGCSSGGSGGSVN